MSLARCWGRFTNLTVSRALGSTVWDVDGKPYIDCASGIAVTNVGHCHPHVVDAIKQQSEKFIHCQVNCHYSDTLLEFVRRFQKHMPEGIDNFFFCNSGAEAVEGTAKLSRAATRRPNLLAMRSAFHGRTGTAMALTSCNHRYTSPCFPAAAHIHHAERPTNDAEVDHCIRALDLYTKGQMSWDTVASVIVEPIQGEGGFHAMPDRWMEHLRQQCTAHGALLCLDEIQSGFGRCGKMFGFENYPTAQPDVVIFGKGIAAGLPLAGFASSKAVMDTLEPGTHGGTYGGNPVAAAAAIAVLDVMEDPAFLRNVADRSKQIVAAMESLRSRYPHAITGVRATGMMTAFDIASNEDAKRLTAHMLEHHSVIMVGPSGIEGRTLRFIPPLVITESEVAQVLDAFEKTCAALF